MEPEVSCMSPNASLSKSMSIQKREAIAFYIFLAPVILGLIAFNYIPTIASLVLSFTKWNMLEPPEFIGFGNYIEMFKSDIHITSATSVTVIYAFIGVIWVLLCALGLALFLNRGKKGIGLFRTLYYLPSMIAAGAPTMIIWYWILGDQGFLNTVLFKLFRISGPSYLTDVRWVLPTIIFISVWGLGGSMVIFIAGLKGVPEELYEAASIDGASKFKKFLNITIPCISPVILFNLIMGFIGAFQAFTQPYVLTSGGPADASLLWVIYMFQQAFTEFRMGYAAALAWVLFIVIMLMTLIILNTSAKFVFYGGEQGNSKDRF